MGDFEDLMNISMLGWEIHSRHSHVCIILYGVKVYRTLCATHGVVAARWCRASCWTRRRQVCARGHAAYAYVWTGLVLHPSTCRLHMTA